MDVTALQTWITANPALALSLMLGVFLFTYLLARLVFGRGLTYLSNRTKNQFDDIIIKKTKPYRASLLVPFILLYLFAYLAPDYQSILEKTALIFILWLTMITLMGLLDALNQIYESRPSFSGVSIQGYLDILKILLIAVSIILSISLLTDESPVLLLSGLGALTAILLLVFQDTIMSFIASLQISLQNLVREGDWLEVPSYEADGEVINMSLHTVKVQNWDKTISVIPTSKLVQAAYKNWRGMEESGGRRIKRAILLNQNSLRFCTPAMIEHYARIDSIGTFVAEKQKAIQEYNQKHGGIDSMLDGPQVTNLEFYRAYVEAYLKNHPGIHQEKMDFLVRELDPSDTGLPIEIYAFTKTTAWPEYERIQAEIMDHLLAATAVFDLRIFQRSSGSDEAISFENPDEKLFAR